MSLPAGCHVKDFSQALVSLGLVRCERRGRQKATAATPLV